MDKGLPIDTRFTPFWHITIVILAIIILIAIGASPTADELLLSYYEPTSESLILLILVLIAVWVIPTTEETTNGNQT